MRELVKGKKQKKVKGCDEEKKEGEEKGYIHVRARRGQATDSHSLAERVLIKKIYIFLYHCILVSSNYFWERITFRVLLNLDAVLNCLWV